MEIIKESKMYVNNGTIYGRDIAKSLEGTNKNEKYGNFLIIRESETGDCKLNGITYDVFMKGQRPQRTWEEFLNNP